MAAPIVLRSFRLSKNSFQVSRTSGSNHFECRFLSVFTLQCSHNTSDRKGAVPKLFNNAFNQSTNHWPPNELSKRNLKTCNMGLQTVFVSSNDNEVSKKYSAVNEYQCKKK